MCDAKTDEPDREIEAVELHSAARSTVLECKGRRPSETLERAITLLRQVLDQQSYGHPFRPSTLHYLVRALSIQHNQQGWTENPSELVTCLTKILEFFNTEDVDIEYTKAELEKQSASMDFVCSLLNEFSQSVERSDIDSAIQRYQRLLEPRPPINAHGVIVLVELSEALMVRYYLVDQPEDLDNAISLLQEARVLCSNRDHEQLWHRYSIVLISYLWLRFNRSDNPQDMYSVGRDIVQADYLVPYTESDALEMFRNHGSGPANLNTVITLFRRSHLLNLALLDRLRSLRRLANMIYARFKQDEDPMYLEEAISLRRKALRLCPPSHTDRHSILHDLAKAFWTRFNCKRHPLDLEYATQLFREALDHCPVSHPDRCSRLNSIGVVLQDRFNHNGHPQDLQEAIILLREALELCPPPHLDRSMVLDHLGNALSTRFEQEGCIQDLNEAITFHRAALDLCPASDPDRVNPLNNLAGELLARFEYQGDPQDLETALSLYREALVMLPPSHLDRLVVLSNIAATIVTRFEESGCISDLEEAITLEREVLESRPPPHPQRQDSLNNLAGALMIRFEHNGYLPDLEEIISLHREALGYRPAPHPARPSSLNNLGVALCQRFDETGNLRDLEEAIVCHREALELYPANHPKRSGLLNNLAGGIYRRYTQKGRLMDLEEAISFYKESVGLCPASHPLSCSLNNLACMHLKRFERKGDMWDLEKTIVLHKEALELRPAPHPDRPNSLNNLANALTTLFEMREHLPDLEDAISLHKEVLEFRPTSTPQRLGTLRNLACALSLRFKQTGHLSDLEESIALYHELFSCLPNNHPNNSWATSLGLSLITLHSHTKQSEYLEDAMTVFRKGAVCDTAPLLAQFNNSRVWARQAATWHHESALEAFQQAIGLLPLLSSVDMTLRDRQLVLELTKNFASEACSWAVGAGLLERALEFLSAAKTVFWSESLHLRTPLDELETLAPDLAEQLRTISSDIEHSSRRDMDSLDGFSKVQDLEKEASRCRLLNGKRIGILNEIRKFSGFENFMLPKSFSALKRACTKGPVVALNASGEECSALLLNQGSVTHIPLPAALTFELLCTIPGILRMAFSGSKTSVPFPRAINQLLDSIDRDIQGNNLRKGIRVPEHGYTSEEIFCIVLKFLWLTVAHPVIAALKLKRSNHPPRLWWYPSGPFTLLPIHAAGIYEGKKQVSASDYIISTYVPTLEVLLERDPPPPKCFSMLAVIEANTPGQHPLPYALKELEMMERHVPDQWLTVLGTKETQSSVEGISSSLSNTSFIHFACHGWQDVIDPLNSALFLRSGRLTMSKLMETSLPNATLAFLNACETAKGDDNIPDEAMHLSASLLFAGFRGVVGTTWSIEDADAPLVADVFYGHLFRKGSDTYPDPTEAAYALHLAVKKLRTEKKVGFKRWIPFIHMGI